MDLKSLSFAVTEVADERGIPQQKIFEVIEEAIASAYKKEYGRKKQKIAAELDPKNGELKFWQVKQVVSPEMLLSEDDLESQKERHLGGEEALDEDGKIRFNSERHILLEEAKAINPEVQVGEEIKLPLETREDFGRIAAQTAKQVILQKIKEVEKEEAFKEFKDKEGEVVSGVVQRIEPGAIFLDVGRTSAVLPRQEQIYGEKYRIGQRLKLYVLETEQTSKGPQVVVSRIYPKLISKLFELEVPEIGAKQLEIKAIAREPGSRSKVAATALEEGIDPIGALVGQRGTRILAVINELAGEKIDVIEWNEKTEKFLANALSPAKVLEVRLMPKNKALAIIPDDQLSLAIGKEGQNVRLAAKLTGWKIDIKSAGQVEQEIKEGKSPEESETADESAGSPETEAPAVDEDESRAEKPKKARKKPAGKKTKTKIESEIKEAETDTTTED
ncbi:MAG: transcription termination factor NusA [Candidatus Pacebacteria bacterium]|nr:transcription termination factor NusA [Candidatus Paceibacterota bacterium]